jgi:hypothetical protein
VCLRCRHDALEAARLRQRAVITRVGGAAAAAALVIAVTAVGVSVARGRLPVATQHTASAPAAHDSVRLEGEAIADGAIAPVVEHQRPAVVTPVLPSGRTVLADSAIVSVTDSLVAVDFDEIMLRTRRPVKFENFVRSTLSAIYGAPVRRALDALPDGAIASQGDLLTELPHTGVRIPLDSGHVMMVWPETRPGEDGPLVIRFRVTVS